MKLTIIISFLTTIVSIMVKVVGLPDQIKSNYKRKSTTGLSSWFVWSAFLSYLLWTIHGVQVHDKALIIGQGLGVITTSIIVWQIMIYRKNSKEPARNETKIWAFFSGGPRSALKKINSAKKTGKGVAVVTVEEPADV